MKKVMILFVLMLSISGQYINAQKSKSDANLFGHVICSDCDDHMSFATIQIKGSTIGTTTDETGHFQLINIPEGIHILVASYLGYKPIEQEVSIKPGETKEVNFTLIEDAMGIEEIVVSADRAEQKRTEAPVIVNTISPRIFNTTQSVTLSEGLNFAPGLRLENNCQNCGFSQVRMNGMEGPYSQILINSRPIFSGLAGVYGLELIPSNMIEKVEVVRGGGSALFGSNAIAGTINIIMKEPKTNSYEGGTTYALTGAGTTGGETHDYTVNFNASVVSDDSKSGISVYGFTRERAMYDANKDGFSELAPIENLTFGARAFHKFGYRDKLSVDFFAINENREGGSDHSYPLHQRKIAEAVSHDLKAAAIAYERYFRKYDMLSVYASGQFLKRDSYYGAGYSTKDYGITNDNTANIGIQYKAVFDGSSLVAGIENTSGFLTDQKLGAPVIENNAIVANNPHTLVANQSLITTGVFAQYDITLNKFKASLGARFDHYEISDMENVGGDKTGDVFSPRVSLMYFIYKELQARATYSQGYRAPQIFDEDLHINTSDLHQVIHENDPGLKQETSHSYMVSLDFNKLIGFVYTGFLIEGFYTKLKDAFANDIGEPDENNIVTYTRVNSTGASVRGVNAELRLKPLKKFELSSGFTMQESEYEEKQAWGDNKILRAPNHYGFIAIDWDLYKRFCLSVSGNYTGSILALYEGVEDKPGLYIEEVENDEGGMDEVQLINTKSFLDFGAKLSYTIKLNGASVQIFGGVKNIFNSYQSDFDRGELRDPGYMYGPVSPRTIYMGIKFGNLLK